MNQPTHTHCLNGGKFVEIAQHQGTGPLEGQWLVLYGDLIKGVESVTTQADWLNHWRPLETDDCPVCLGAGHDHIKGNKDRPCGQCYGLGKVRADGEQVMDAWELATVAINIIHRQRIELEQLRAIEQHPGVLELVDRERQQMIDDSTARSEQAWRGSQGHGPSGQRYTGD